MFRRLRDWWTLNSKPAHSPEYDAAMERKMPGFIAQQANLADDAKERRKLETEWWAGVVAMQENGQVKEAEEHTLANIDAIGRFVLDPLERLGMLHARDVERLLRHGDRAGAEAAAREASRWMRVWASHSTSGGEGTARSNAASEMEADLAQKLGPTSPARGV